MLVLKALPCWRRESTDTLIVRGEGGVHAIRDALVLSKVLGQINIQETPMVHKAIDMYHAEVMERGAEAVRKSRGAHSRNGDQVVAWGHTARPLPQANISLSSLI